MARVLGWREIRRVDGDKVRELSSGQGHKKNSGLFFHNQSLCGSKQGFQTVIPGPVASA